MAFDPEALRSIRAERRLTLAELAERSGVSLSAVNTIVAGKHVPSYDTAERLAEALSVSLDELSTVLVNRWEGNGA